MFFLFSPFPPWREWVGAWLLTEASPPQCHRLALNLQPFFFFFFVMCCWWLCFYIDAKLNCSTENIKKKPQTHRKEMEVLKNPGMVCENKFSGYSARSACCVMLIYKGRNPLFLLIGRSVPWELLKTVLCEYWLRKSKNFKGLESGRNKLVPFY